MSRVKLYLYLDLDNPIISYNVRQVTMVPLPHRDEPKCQAGDHAAGNSERGGTDVAMLTWQILFI